MRKIKLTSDEKELFDLLRSVIIEDFPNTSLRVAGGWVRDKLLNKQSSDIDFMVDNVSGEKIARHLSDKLKLEGPHVVEANPEASKHLETAGLKIPISSGNVFDLDFAMARQEVYSDDSRIPEIKPATPQEDAFRRDLTINSLFFNIMTNEIEDFTGNGISDLKNKIIRTPENPLKTFQDDPLRIFRTIRFVARYNGKIDSETLTAMHDSSLREAIQKKVKKERIQEELFKTLKGPNPVVAINLLKQTGILEDIMTEAVKGTKFEGKLAPFDMDQNNPHHELTVWEHTIMVVENILDFYPDDEKRAVMILTALMHDMGKLFYDIHEHKINKTSYSGHEYASEEISRLILKYLKFNNSVIEQVSKLSKYHMRLHQVVQDKNLSAEGKRLISLRKFVRKMMEDNVDVMDIMYHSMADAYGKGKRKVSPEVVKKYATLKNQLHIASETMHIDPSKKRVVSILNGKEIMSIFKIDSGPIIGEIFNFLKDAMDENPEISKDEAIKLISEKCGINEN